MLSSKRNLFSYFDAVQSLSASAGQLYVMAQVLLISQVFDKNRQTGGGCEEI
jgi:hypothetical protein